MILQAGQEMQHGTSTMISTKVTDDDQTRIAVGPTNTTLLMQTHPCLCAWQSWSHHLVNGCQCFIIRTVKAANQTHGCLTLAAHGLLDSRETHTLTHFSSKARYISGLSFKNPLATRVQAVSWTSDFIRSTYISQQVDAA